MRRETGRFAGFKNLAGEQFASWTVLSFAGRRPDNKQMWNCRCACGEEREVESYNLTSGRSKSCRRCSAAVVGAGIRTHGMTGHVVYKRWQAIKTRCLNPKSKDWKDYGGRRPDPVVIAPEWVNDFAAFYAHIGDPPTELHTVDRINPWGHYEPGNVRWATQGEQMANTRRSKKHADERIARRLVELRAQA